MQREQNPWSSSADVLQHKRHNMAWLRTHWIQARMVGVSCNKLSISFKVRSNEVLSQQDDALRCHCGAWGVGVGTHESTKSFAIHGRVDFFPSKNPKETIEESNLEDFRFCVVCLWKLLVGSDVIEGRAQEVRSPRGWWGSDCLTYVAWVVNLPIITAECNEILELGQLRYVLGSYYVQQIYIIYAYRYTYNIYIHTMNYMYVYQPHIKLRAWQITGLSRTFLVFTLGARLEQIREDRFLEMEKQFLGGKPSMDLLAGP